MKAKSNKNAQNSVSKSRKGKQHGYGSPDFWFKPGNPWRFEKGKSGNPGGRPKLLSDAYREWLAAENEDGVTNAAVLASRLGEMAVSFADVLAAKELRQATEGDLIRDLSHMTDAELDEFIAQRERGTLSGVSSAGTTPAKTESHADESTSV